MYGVWTAFRRRSYGVCKALVWRTMMIFSTLSLLIYTHICIQVYVYTCLCTRVCVHVYVYTCTHTHVCIHVYVYAYMYTRICIWISLLTLRKRNLHWSSEAKLLVFHIQMFYVRLNNTKYMLSPRFTIIISWWVFLIVDTVYCTGLKCSECGYNCHEKCMSHVPKNCSSGRLKGVANGSSGTANQSANPNSAAPLSPSDGERTSIPLHETLLLCL